MSIVPRRNVEVPVLAAPGAPRREHTGPAPRRESSASKGSRLSSGSVQADHATPKARSDPTPPARGSGSRLSNGSAQTDHVTPKIRSDPTPPTRGSGSSDIPSVRRKTADEATNSQSVAPQPSQKGRGESAPEQCSEVAAPKSSSQLCPATPKVEKAEKISRMIAAFRTFDVNHDGVMDRSELERLIWSLKPNFKQEDLQMMFDAVDTNGDGVIQYEEFIKWLFGDMSILSKLNVGPQSPGGAIRLQVFAPDGKLLNGLQAASQDTVKDLRLRICVALGIPVERLGDVFVRLKAGSAHLPDQHLVSKLHREELQVVLDNHGFLFTAARMRVQAWQAEIAETRASADLPNEVRLLQFIRESGVICAVVGKTMIAAWDEDVEHSLWRVNVGSCVTCLACHGTLLYAACEDGQVFAYETTSTSGEIAWRGKALYKGVADGIRALHATPSDHSMVCVGTTLGQLFAWDALSGRQTWDSKHGESDRQIDHLVGASRRDASHPDTIFSAGSCRVIAWDARSGEQLWQSSAIERQSIQLLFYRELYDTLCVATQGLKGKDGKPIALPSLRSLDGRSGKELFSTDCNDLLHLQGRRQYVFSASAKAVQAWDTLNGSLAWEVQVLKPGPSSIQAFAFADDLDVLCVGTPDGLCLLDSKNGSSRGQVSVRFGVSIMSYTPHL